VNGRRALTWVLLALVPAAVFVVGDAVMAWGAGRVDAFPSVGAYRLTLNVVVLVRDFGACAALLVVWGLLRSRGAPRWALVLAVLSAPLAYTAVQSVRAQEFFPPAQALYYGVNPLFVASLGLQVACAALAEGVWRMWGRRAGADRGRPVAWPIVVAGLAGVAITFVSVGWDGGVHWFYVYQQGYKALFLGRSA